MNINEMTDEQKSVILARLVWREVWITDADDAIINSLFYDDNTGGLPIWTSLSVSLYDPANMALAWLVLNWASAQLEPPMCNFINWFYAFDAECGDEIDWISMPPAEAQRLWLDKILELTMEAGLCPSPTGN